MKKDIKLPFVLFCIILCLLLLFFIKKNTNENQPLSEVKLNVEYNCGVNVLKISGKSLGVDLADTSALRTQGLSGRTELSPNCGMLFVFEKLDHYGFWMPDMNFSIDIVWIGKDKRIVHIEEKVLPESYPKIFIPSAPALYVLEVPAGFVAENKIKVGDDVAF